MSIRSFLRSRVFVALLVLGAALAIAAACSSDDDGGGETPAGGGETPAADGGGGGGATADIAMVPSIQFDKSELTIAADTDVAVTADNTDEGIQHNFSVYADDSASESLGKTDICAGPCTNVVSLNLSAGEYFFRCDVHPAVMMGTLIVE